MGFGFTNFNSSDSIVVSEMEKIALSLPKAFIEDFCFSEDFNYLLIHAGVRFKCNRFVA